MIFSTLKNLTGLLIILPNAVCAARKEDFVKLQALQKGVSKIAVKGDPATFESMKVIGQSGLVTVKYDDKSGTDTLWWADCYQYVTLPEPELPVQKSTDADEPAESHPDLNEVTEVSIVTDKNGDNPFLPITDVSATASETPQVHDQSEEPPATKLPTSTAAILPANSPANDTEADIPTTRAAANPPTNRAGKPNQFDEGTYAYHMHRRVRIKHYDAGSDTYDIKIKNENDRRHLHRFTKGRRKGFTKFQVPADEMFESRYR